MGSLDVTSRHFDEKASGYYERNYRRPRNRHERGLALRREICLDMLADDHRAVLDLGCGPGAMALPLIAAGRSVVAMDLAPKMVGAARDLAAAHAPGGHGAFCVGDATRLPFAAASFDAVVSTGMLEYIPAADQVIAEVSRVLRPGGAFVVTVSLPRTLERRVTRVLGPLAARLRGTAPAPTPYHRAFTASDLDEALGVAGFGVVDRRYSYFAPFPFDAVWPRLVTEVDDLLGGVLQQFGPARDRAKTYVVLARKG